MKEDQAMSHDLATVEISTSLDLLHLVDEITESGSARVLVRDGQPVAVVQPIAEIERPRRRRRSADPADDPLLGIIGMLDTGEPTEIARFKDQYIADAIDPR